MYKIKKKRNRIYRFKYYIKYNIHIQNIYTAPALKYYIYVAIVAILKKNFKQKKKKHTERIVKNINISINNKVFMMAIIFVAKNIILGCAACGMFLFIY